LGGGLMEQPWWSAGVRDFPAEFTVDHGRGLSGVGRVKIEKSGSRSVEDFLVAGSTCPGDPVFGMPSGKI
jgi:hypothetical protein